MEIFRTVLKIARSTPITIALCLSIGNNYVQAGALKNQIDSQLPNENKEILQQIDRYNLENNSQEQIVNVFQLRDVSPGDWAFEALRSLVERYGCIVGYPDRTFRGDRALTRYEFAAGLNACLNQIERLIAASEAVLREDIETLQRLVEEFETELASIGTRIDDLEGRVTFLEDNQFSTTTKLSAEVVIGAYGIAAGERNGGEAIDGVPALGHRTRLELSTSFTGKDLLLTRLATGNVAALSPITGTFEGELGFAQPDDNDIALELLFYQFPLTENINLWLEAVGGVSFDFTKTFNFLDGDGGSGAVSLFGTRNPIYLTAGETGVGLQSRFGIFEFSAGYLAGNASNPSNGNGLFDGSYSAIAQLGFVTDDDFGAAFTFVHGYNQFDTGTGSNRANFRSFTESLFGEPVPAVNNSYGLSFSWGVTERIILGGWGTYTRGITLDTLQGQIERGTLDIWNWAATVAVLDLIKEGSTAGIIVGMEPWLANSSIPIPGVRDLDRDTSVHIEALFEYPIVENISITPAIIVITSPDYNSSNSALVIGTIRTTFTF